MSSNYKIGATCPHCAREQNVVVWKSLNVTLDKAAKQVLIDGKINTLECKNCGIVSYIDIDLLYHDMEQEFCALYIPFSTLGEKNLTAYFDGRGNLRENCRDEGGYDYMNHIHFVFDMGELIRYVLFRDRLYDDYKKAESMIERIPWRVKRKNTNLI